MPHCRASNVKLRCPSFVGVGAGVGARSGGGGEPPQPPAICTATTVATTPIRRSLRMSRDSQPRRGCCFGGEDVVRLRGRPGGRRKVGGPQRVVYPGKGSEASSNQWFGVDPGVPGNETFQLGEPTAGQPDSRTMVWAAARTSIERPGCRIRERGTGGLLGQQPVPGLRPPVNARDHRLARPVIRMLVVRLPPRSRQSNRSVTSNASAVIPNPSAISTTSVSVGTTWFFRSSVGTRRP